MVKISILLFQSFLGANHNLALFIQVITMFTPFYLISTKFYCLIGIEFEIIWNKQNSNISIRTEDMINRKIDFLGGSIILIYHMFIQLLLLCIHK